jgi:hypothetical protein
MISSVLRFLVCKGVACSSVAHERHAEDLQESSSRLFMSLCISYDSYVDPLGTEVRP